MGGNNIKSLVYNRDFQNEAPLSPEEAVSRIINALTPQPCETLGLSECLGHTLAQDITSRVTLPPFDMSAVDGYAFRSADVDHINATLPVAGESRAGSPFEETIPQGHVVRIYKGSPLPRGTDAIISMQEVQHHNGMVTFHTLPPAGHNIRYAGLDFSEGETCLKAGKVLTARDICLAAAMNVPWLPVRRKPRIAVFATGNELVMPGEEHTPGGVFASTSLALCAYITAWGGIPTNLGICHETEEALQRMAQAASGMDMLVSTGGLSEAARNLTWKALRKNHVDLSIWDVDIGSGKPLLFGKYNQTTPVLGLPGSPVSCLICALLFLKPALEKMLGNQPQEAKKHYATLGRNLDINDVKLDYLRATLTHDSEGKLIVNPVSSQDSFMLSTFAQADCLINYDQSRITKGSVVEIIPLTGSLIST